MREIAGLIYALGVVVTLLMALDRTIATLEHVERKVLEP